MLAELSKTTAMLVGRTENTGSPNARINKVRSKSWRKNIGGRFMRPQGRPLAWTPPSMNSNRLENTKRRGFFLIKYGINSNGKASRPSKAVGLRNSILFT